LYGYVLEQRPALEAAAAAAEEERAVARAASPYYGADRAKFLGPLAFDGAYAPHLTAGGCTSYQSS
jgi:hypothetical protein